jgi:hypothetical protein
MPGFTPLPAPAPAATIVALAPAPAAPAALPNLGHPADEAPFWKICGGVAAGIVWFKIPAPAPTPTPVPGHSGRPATPAVTALYTLGTGVIAPKVSIGLNPAPFGITGLESYFWLTGYDGSPIYRSVQATDPATGLPATVELRAIPKEYRWSFGDGAAVTTTSLGAAYPAASDIRHTYDIRSDRSPMATNGLYEVQVAASFDVAYQVSVPGAGLSPTGWVAFADFGLAPISSGTGQGYRVIEVVSRLAGGP